MKITNCVLLLTMAVVARGASDTTKNPFVTASLQERRLQENGGHGMLRKIPVPGARPPLDPSLPFTLGARHSDEEDHHPLLRGLEQNADFHQRLDDHRRLDVTGGWIPLPDESELLKGNSNEVLFSNDNAISSDGRCVAFSSPYQTPGLVQVFEILSDKTIVQKGRTLEGAYLFGVFGGVDLSEDCSFVVVGDSLARPEVNGVTYFGEVRVYWYNGTDWDLVGSGIPGTETAGTKTKDWGYHVSISDDGQMVSSAEKPVAEGNTLRVFKLTNGEWEQHGATITNLPYFFHRSTLSGNGKYLVGSAPRWPNNGDRGFVHVYRYNEQNDEWDKLLDKAETYQANYGYMVAISTDGDMVVVGAPSARNDQYADGRVDVYLRNNSTSPTSYDGPYDLWFSDTSPPFANSHCGIDLGLSGNRRIIVGCPGIAMWVYPGSFKGYVTVLDFSRDASGNGVFTPVGDTIKGKGIYDFIGSQVGISGDGNRILWGSYSWGEKDDGKEGRYRKGRARVYDYILPTMNLPPNETVECGSDTSPGSTGEPIFTDFCDGLTFDPSDLTETSACVDNVIETITRTWTASDDCGNTVTDNQFITVVDTTPPTISVPSDATVECGGDISPVATGGDATGADSCSDFSITYADDSTRTNACVDTGVFETITRTWTSTDECGNMETGEQTITVVDTTDPTITVPSDATVECGGDISPVATGGDATGADSCSDVSITYADDSTLTNTCVDTGVFGTITRTWTSTDECGNIETGEQTINVVDTTAPTITVPSDATVECGGDIRPGATGGDATGADSCSDVSITYTDDSTRTNACIDTGIFETTTRTWTSTDECGNIETGEQTITVIDTTPPSISVPSDVTVECGGDISPIATGGDATGADSCSDVIITFTDDSTPTNACVDTGIFETITRTWTSTDECGNIETGEQTITVIDTTPPSISVPSDVTVGCGGDINPDATGHASGSDLCAHSEDIVVEFVDDPGGCCDLDGCCHCQSIVRTWSATDECGHTSSGEQVITIDDAPPMVTSVDSVVIPKDTEFSILDSVSDNCHLCSLELDQSITSMSETGVYLDYVTLTATDAAGNEGSCTLPVLVVYDPDGGFVTGNGWFNSPAGAYMADESLEGMANFCFVSKYEEGKSAPTGQTQFVFTAEDLHFHSTSCDWLVVTGQSCAKFKGSGEVNGSEGYSFMVTACDESPNDDSESSDESLVCDNPSEDDSSDENVLCDESPHADTIRVKIWETSDESLVCDNQKESEADSCDGTVLCGGQVKIHKEE